MKRTISSLLVLLLVFCLAAPAYAAGLYYDVTVTVTDPSGHTVTDEQVYLPSDATMYGILVQTYGTHSKDFEQFDASTRKVLDNAGSGNLSELKDRVDANFKLSTKTTIGKLGVGTYVINDSVSGISISVYVAKNTTGKPGDPDAEPEPGTTTPPATTEPKPTDTTPKPTANPFTDVKTGDYFLDAVLWAVDKGITKGTSDTTFGPNAACTRAQVVTFLWRAAGSPKATAANPFTDVKEGDYFYDAVLWAVAQNITKGTSDTTFGPNDACTRAQVVTFLYRSQKTPEVNGKNVFSDVGTGDYFYNAVIWAVQKEITKGTSDTTFSPNQSCTRAQIVTFLYRLLG